jgi:hypothetical protein
VQLQRFSVVSGISRLDQLSLRAFADLEIAQSPVEHADVLIVAGDTTCENVDSLFAACSSVLSAGVRYVCCWGPGCERLHNLFDEAHVARQIAADREFELMTTWHSTEALADALSFGVHTAWPSSQVADRRVVVVALGDEVSAEVSAVLTRGAPFLDEA